MRIGRVVVLGLSLALSGCAYVTAVAVEPGSNFPGIRIYDVKPLLVVTPTDVSILLVPNYNRAYALSFGSFLAEHDLTVEFENAFIKKITSNQDTTKFVEAILAVINKAFPAPGASGFSGGSSKGGAGERFGIFEFVFDHYGNLAELRPVVHPEHFMRAKPAVGTVVAVPANQGVAQPGGSGKIDVK